MSPKRSNLILTADIPNIELDIFVCDRLDVESDSWDGRDILAQLELVQDCYARLVFDQYFILQPHRQRTSLSSSVKTQHE